MAGKGIMLEPNESHPLYRFLLVGLPNCPPHTHPSSRPPPPPNHRRDLRCLAMQICLTAQYISVCLIGQYRVVYGYWRHLGLSRGLLKKSLAQGLWNRTICFPLQNAAFVIHAEMGLFKFLQPTFEYGSVWKVQACETAAVQLVMSGIRNTPLQYRIQFLFLTKIILSSQLTQMQFWSKCYD